ncbi:hypothetical protein R5R35_011176 [Gryllus longicercus]|uniref:Uncharacterized protein n=1 Tax=Gryllus longicercus TaxID=2509291 RepID=A0AAN9Z3U4_9ORTH
MDLDRKLSTSEKISAQREEESDEESAESSSESGSLQSSINSHGNAKTCGCACARELRALRAEMEQQTSAMRTRVQRQEQTLGRALASLLPAVEALTAKSNRRLSAGAPSPASPGTAGPSGTAPAAVAPPPALFAAAAAGAADGVRRRLAQGDDPSARDARGDTALHCAAALNRVAALDALLEAAGAAALEDAERARWAASAANAPGRDFRRPLHAAAEAGHTDAACSLLAAGACVDAADARGATPLHLAVANGHCQVATLLLEEGAPADAADKCGLTPLCYAALANHGPLVRLLLEKGADPQLCDAQQNSALHCAARQGHRETVQLLLENGMDVGAKNELGRTALHDAAYRGHVVVMEVLLDKGAETDAVDKDGKTPLLLAAAGGHAKAVKKLLAKGATVVVEATNGGSNSQRVVDPGKLPLVAAVEGGSAEAVKVVALAGATPQPLRLALERARNPEVVWALADASPTPDDFRAAATDALSPLAAAGSAAVLRAVLATGVDATGERAAIALLAAAEHNRADCVATLLDAGVTDEKQLALHAAIKFGHEKCLSGFLQRGMTFEQKNKALVVAKDCHKVEIMRILVEAGANPFVVDSKDVWDLIKRFQEHKMHTRTS